MVGPAITLASSIFLFSIAVALLVAIIPLLYQAKSMRLERPKQKKELAEKIKRETHILFAVAVFALICGAILLYRYSFGSLPTPTG